MSQQHSQDIGQFKALWNQSIASQRNLNTAEGAVYWAIRLNREARNGYLLREMAGIMEIRKKGTGEPSPDGLKQWEQFRESKAVARRPTLPPGMTVKTYFDRMAAAYLDMKKTEEGTRKAINERLCALTDDRDKESRVPVKSLAAAVGVSTPNLYKRRSTGRAARMKGTA